MRGDSFRSWSLFLKSEFYVRSGIASTLRSAKNTMRTFLIPLCLLFLSLVVNADELVTQFRVVKTEDVIKQTSKGGEIDYSKVPSVAHGYFEQSCSLYLKTKDHQYRIKAGYIEGQTLYFSLSMYSQKDKTSIFSSSGEVTLPNKIGTPTMKKGWKSEEYVIIWQRINLES